jgi:hypothetical protein
MTLYRTPYSAALQRDGRKDLWAVRPGPLPTEESLFLPDGAYRLEEINLPAAMAASLAGKQVTVRAFPEEDAFTRRIDPKTESSGWVDPEGNYWNDYQPLRVLFTDLTGKGWRLPRWWLDRSSVDAQLIETMHSTTGEATWKEKIHMPSEWDLEDINIDLIHARKTGGKIAAVEVHVAPGEPVLVSWCDDSHLVWRIPADWRRRRIRLPSYDVLVLQDVPPEVAQEYAGTTVSVNYHPGSLCCLPEQYRFRDKEGYRWPVFKRDCLVLGYGDEEYHIA